MSRPRKSASDTPGARRCAIYTRVSTDHGLDQEFNSLDAQREACEAYIRSQTHERWTLVNDSFDDGGYSGGSLQRPALTRLLAQVDAGRVDIIVVYKVDRLTRSLADFAKLVERFDAQGASFVSITQSFNSTSSMGRLTLNMLLSFAQFEREVTSERIRDKIAASKRKGIWLGGNSPFGYVVRNRKLVACEEEALIIRDIFRRYLALGSLDRLMQELRTIGIRTRVRILSSGKPRGGVFFGRGTLASLLRNRTYLGELNHLGCSYPAEHSAMVDRDVFEEVQERLTSAAAAFGKRRINDQFDLKGLLFDDRGHRMTPTTVRKKGREFRYYISRAFAEGIKDQAGSAPRISAPTIENAVREACKPLWSTDASAQIKGERSPLDTIRRITASRTMLTIELTPCAAENLGENRVVASWNPRSTAVRREALYPDHLALQPIRSDQRATMLLAIARGRALLDKLQTGRASSIDALAVREKRSPRSLMMTLSLAFLAPKIIQSIVDQSLPRGIGLSRLYDLPEDWRRQEMALGLRTAERG